MKREATTLNQITETSQLFDLYGKLLTEKKREVMRLYYEEDMSLAEIGEELKISRAAVHDALKSAERTLKKYEEKLSLLEGYKLRSKLASDMEKELAEIIGASKKEDIDNHIDRIRNLLNVIVE